MRYYVGNDISNMKILKTYNNIRIWEFQQGVLQVLRNSATRLRTEICR